MINFFFGIYVFGRQTQRETEYVCERDREKSPIQWFTPQMITTEKNKLH